MTLVRQLVACMAVANTAGLGAIARGVDADAVRAVQATTASSDDTAGVVASNGRFTDLADEDLQSGISNTEDWPKFSKLPLVGTILTNDDARTVAVSNQYGQDDRGEGSYFAATTDSTETVFVFDIAEDGLLLQLVDTSHHPTPPGLFLAVHDEFNMDRIFSIYCVCLRLMAHPNPDKAAIWQFVEHDGNRYLQIKSNRAASAPQTAGWYLGVPPDSARSPSSNWLAVTPKIEEAMAVGVRAYSPM